MTDEKSTTSNTTTESNTVTDGKVDELARIVYTHLNPATPSSPTVSSPTGSTRTYTSPLMGTSARAAKRRIDSDSGPVRIEGTDIYNQQLQHHYQNVRQILDDQQQPLSSDTNIPNESRQSFNAKRDFFEQRFKTPPPTYDAPPRQKITTTITSTVSTTNVQDRTSSSSNESPSVDRVLEQAVELQKLSNLNATKQETKVPFIIERTEQYQVFLDSANHEVRRTPSISRTSIIPVGKTGHATDLDQAQVQAERLTDDHQAIQSLTRALQEHNVSTINEYKRLPSQTTNQISSTSPSSILLDRTNLPIKSDYSVIDALLNNPIGSIDDRYNELVKLRSNDILKNLRNPEYVNSLKQSTKSTEKNQTKEKKSKTKSSVSTEPVEQSSTTPLVTAQTIVPTQTTEPITTTSNVNTSTSEQSPLIDPKEKKKQDKENKKQLKKNKAKQKSKSDDYSVLDAIIGSPVSIHLPDSYLTKYNVSAPLSQSAPLSSEPTPTTSNTDTTKVTTTASSPETKTKKKSSSKEKKIADNDKNKALFHLTKIVHDVKTHYSNDLPPPSTVSASEPKEPVVSTKPSGPAVQQVTTTTTTATTTSKQTDTQPKSESVAPRIIYRYMDEYGNVLKISSTPPSQLREQPSQLYTNRNTEPPYFYGRHIAIDDERRHPLAQYEQRTTWQDESKLPTTVTREAFESQDKRVPQLIEQSIPASRTVPVSVDHERSSRPSSSQPYQPQFTQPHQYPNQQNIKLAWLPLSYPSDPYYLPAGVAGYETDSTISERSTTYRPLEYALNDGYYRYSARPIHNDYSNRSPAPAFYPPPPPLLSHGGRGISPDYSSNNISRNYIEVYRGGDFRETKPSEIYSLPFNEHIRTSPLIPPNNRHSRYDQYHSERYGTVSNSSPFRSQQTYHSTNTLPHTQYNANVPPSSSVHTSTYYTHRNPNSNRTVQNSPDPDYSNYVRQSKSFDYRPLRSKLQREYRITPNLLVDEWDYPHTSEATKSSTTTTVTTTNRSGLSSPDEVFFPTRNVKA